RKVSDSLLVDFLIRDGLLEQQAVETLTSEVLRDSRLVTASAHIVSKDVALTTFGRYQNLEFLGRGGMAQVYKAYDPTLDRVIALKFVRLDSPEVTERLMLEARAQARIEHDSVCKVFEVGQIDTRNYIAMQYIPGKNLREAYKNLTISQKIKIIAASADAVHSAHKAGLIHRDIKSSNIMIVQNEDSEPHPYVMDFGLAREVGAHGLTISGQILGTPSYMSPEQASGKQVTAATDIYSLGATLYEVITGKLPFPGDSGMQVLMDVISKEPVRPRHHQPNIPLDLETIILKTLEKEPERRYRSARAFAEDLRRFIDEEPILARPPSWLYAIGKKIRRNRLVSALLAVGLIVAFTAFAFALFTRYWAIQQSRYANEFNLEAQDIQQRVRYFYTQPAHDIRAEEATIRKRLQTLEANLKSESSAAQGPGNYALGLGFLALGDYHKARNYLHNAWYQANYHVPQLSYAYGLTLVHLYGKALEEAEYFRIAAEQRTRKKQIEIEFLNPALKFLSQGRAANQAPLYAEAMIAFLEKRQQDAVSKAETALRQTPWLYEADKLQGDAYTALGIQHKNSGDVKEALHFYQSAERCYERAIQKAPSNIENQLGMAVVQFSIFALLHSQKGETSLKAFEKGKKACEQALIIRPDSAEAYKWYGEINTEMGQILFENGQGSLAQMNNSIALFKKGLALDPNDADLLKRLGAAYHQKGNFEQQHGIDPDASFDVALGNYKRAAQLAPNQSEISSKLGALYMSRSWYELEHGRNARESVDLAIANLKESVELEPKDYFGFGMLGLTYSQRAQLEAEQGKDPYHYFDLAIESAQKAIDLNPNFLNSYSYLGSALFWKAQYELNSNVDPLPSLDRAIEAYKGRFKIKPNDGDSFANICEAFNMKSEYQILTGKDAADSVRQAIIYGEKGIQYVPDLDFAILNLGIAYANLAEINLKHPREFSSAVKKSREVLNRALKINSDNAEAHFSLGRLEMMSGNFQKARVHFQDALRLNPKHDKAHALLEVTSK
ncbi:MAG TPA: protein kinase, partial [Acidobacteriota bacterium]|nr:protein kinase [Acidobacteriota bacterium]